MGQMVSMGILSGHPGPRNLIKHVVDYIVSLTTTELSDIPIAQLGRLDAISAIQELSESNEFDQMIEKYADLLEACGFRKLLSDGSRHDAVCALKSYYMFNRFVPSLLQFVEGGKVSCISIDVETGSSSDVNLNTGHLLQALVGCPALPRHVREGIITFDHKCDNLTTINTCAPSINFSKLSVIKEYSAFEELMKNIMIGSYGFGRE